MKKLSKKTLNKAFRNWYYGHLTCFSQEHMQTFGYLCAMLPVIEELYDTKEEQKEALETYKAFFNTEPQLGTIIVGVTVGLEEARANQEGVDSDTINGLRAGLMGPIAGILIEVVKVLVHLVTMGTMTAGVGDFANFLFGCTFVVPAGIIYRLHHNKSRKHAVIGMAAGTVLTTAAACLMNAFVLLPAYGKAFGMPIEAFIEMGSAVHPSVNSLLGFVALIIVPFNLFKYILISVIVFFIYKRIRVILKGD